jgi:ribose transport system permease protein
MLILRNKLRNEKESSGKVRRWDDWILTFASKYSLVVLLFLLIGLFAAIKPSTFGSLTNLQSIATVNAPIAILALGVIFPLLVGEFDLSIGYTLGIAQAVVIGIFASLQWPIPLAIAITIFMVIPIGILMGWIVVRTGIPSLIVTLAGGSVMAGVAYWITGGSVVFANVPEGFTMIARGTLFGVPLPVIYLAVITVVFVLILEALPIGKKFYAIGANREAAFLVGIKVRPLIVISFAVSATCAGIAGVLIASRLASSQASLGPEFLLPAFAAAFLGATAIRPGRFNPIGTVVAVYLLAVATTGLEFLGVPSWSKAVFNGLALLLAVAIARKVTSVRRERIERRYRLSLDV